MPAFSFLLVDHVRLIQFRISFKCAPGLGSEERADEVGEIPAGPSILEQNQERHSQRRHDELHEDVQRNAEHMSISFTKCARRFISAANASTRIRSSNSRPRNVTLVWRLR